MQQLLLCIRLASRSDPATTLKHSTPMSALLCNDHLSINHSLRSYHKLVDHIISSRIIELRLSTLCSVSLLICIRLLLQNHHWLSLERCLIIVN